MKFLIYELNHIRFIHLSWKKFLINKLIIISEFGLDQLKWSRLIDYPNFLKCDEINPLQENLGFAMTRFVANS
jgi:hypothetical protein